MRLFESVCVLGSKVRASGTRIKPHKSQFRRRFTVIAFVCLREGVVRLCRRCCNTMQLTKFKKLNASNEYFFFDNNSRVIRSSCILFLLLADLLSARALREIIAG
jgi:hypothetical protein